MTRRARVLLLLLLRFLGITGLFALVAVVMPLSWMADIHRWLGLGEMPMTPIVEYLARTVSSFYALFGALCLILAADLDRYRRLVQFLGIGFALVGVVFTGVDLVAGMPWWWAAFEGPPGLAVGVWMFFLAAEAPAEVPGQR